MQLDRLNNHLQDAMRIDGDILHIGVYRKAFFEYLVKSKRPSDKTVCGVFDLSGVGKASKYDNPKHPDKKFSADERIIRVNLKNLNNYTLINSSSVDFVKNIPENKYCFALIDTINYYPSKIALKLIWDKMSYGGVVYIRGYHSNKNESISKAINEYIDEHNDEIIVSRQMSINGFKEDVLAIKCYNKKHKPSNWNISKTLSRPLTVAMVYKTGGDYDIDYVNKLASSIKNNTNFKTEIVCLTDNSLGINKSVDRVIKLTDGFPKWWSKIELFKLNLFSGNQVFYFDLDTIITGNLDDIFLYDREFCALRDFYHLYKMASGVMSWNSASVARIYEKFIQNPKQAMEKYINEGDQGWINQYKPQQYEFFQDLYPNEIVSYKKDCIDSKTNKAVLPNSAKVVCFHGKPRPHEVQNVVTKHWSHL